LANLGKKVSFKILTGKSESPYVIVMLLLYMLYSNNPFSNQIKRSTNGNVLCTPAKAYGRVQVEIYSFLKIVQDDGEYLVPLLGYFMPGKMSPMRTKQKSYWTRETVWTQRNQYSLFPPRNRKKILRIHSL